MKYALLTFGCRVNQADSLELEAALLARGATPADPDAADLVVVNTCSVTASADQGARQVIRRVARSNSGARIVVTGCYATRAPQELAPLPNVIRVVANPDKARLLDAMDELLPASTGARPLGDGSCGAVVEPGVAGRTAYTLRAQTGCVEACAYCIIPSTRGPSRSVLPNQVVAELVKAASLGFREVALTGVHLGSYGRDLVPATSLEELLAALDRAAPADLRLRISSLEPMDCTAEIVDLVARSRSIAPHFHLPLQHASDRVLQSMRRGYTLDDYSSLVERVRQRLPAASIGTDLIVGFPGEEPRDIEILASYLERSPITHAHVFPYSDRPGTAASRMTPKVSGTAIRERAGLIRGLSGRLTARFQASQVGLVHRSLTLDDGTTALTGNYLKIAIPAGRRRNEWIDVRLTSASPMLFGEVVPAEGDRPRPIN